MTQEVREAILIVFAEISTFTGLHGEWVGSPAQVRGALSDALKKRFGAKAEKRE